MRTLKLWAGIAGVIVSGYFLIDSCYAAAWNNLTMSGHINGIIGIIVAALLLAGSIVRISMRDASDDSGSIICLVLFAIAAALAFFVAPIYRYMSVWASICLVMAAISVLMILVQNLKSSKKPQKRTQNFRFFRPHLS